MPGKIVSFSRKQHAVVSFSGVEKEISVELVAGVKKNDWVTVHAGYAIGKITADDAKRTQELLNDR